MPLCHLRNKQARPPPPPPGSLCLMGRRQEKGAADTVNGADAEFLRGREWWARA